MPQHHMVIPHYMGRSREIDIENKRIEENRDGIHRENSFSSLTPLQDIPLLLPQEADGVDAPSVDQKLSSQHMNHKHVDQPTGVSCNISFSSMNPKVEALDPDTQMNGLIDDLYCMDLESGTNINLVAQSGLTSSNEWSESSEEGDHAVAADDCGQTGPRTACKCQVSNAS